MPVPGPLKLQRKVIQKNTYPRQADSCWNLVRNVFPVDMTHSGARDVFHATPTHPHLQDSREGQIHNRNSLRLKSKKCSIQEDLWKLCTLKTDSACPSNTNFKPDCWLLSRASFSLAKRLAYWLQRCSLDPWSSGGKKQRILSEQHSSDTDYFPN